MSARPSVTLKLATSIDGRIALASGESQWITNSDSRKRAHRMRATHDAVLTGVGTVMADDPLLTARLDGYMNAQPLRVIADTTARTPVDGQLVRSASVERPVLIVTGTRTSDELETARRAGDLDREGLTVAKTHGDPVAPGDILEAIDREIQVLGREPLGMRPAVLIEGGGRVAASFMRAGCVDRLEWFRAPIIVGGDGLPGIGDLGLADLKSAARFTLVATERIGSDVLDTYVSAKED